SEESIVNEARRMASLPDFKGSIHDVGGPTANMYGFECDKNLTEGACRDTRCVYPRVCKEMKVDHSRQIRLLTRLRKIPGIRRVFVASGIRYDLVLSDHQHGLPYMKELVGHHVSGQMKIAPEHTEDRVLKKMGKPSQQSLSDFADLFYDLTKKANKQQFLTYYLIAAHPGCTLDDMQALKAYTQGKLRMTPEQVQIFTPLPSTWSALMYYTETDPITGKRLFVEKHIARKEEQKNTLTTKPNRPRLARPAGAARPRGPVKKGRGL
ncbi:MAG: YgiQ family radical SAM protein, partial [candidate division Zixibacteria bacterium]|nr:YgiQ family radical SAM protein [candidate division Zixibacteria bacterium]